MAITAIVPVNHRARDVSPEAIASEVAYALQVGEGYAQWIAKALNAPDSGMSVVRGLDVLEVGPGPSLGAAVLLACGGARVTVTDRFAPRWEEAYHRPFFEALLTRVEQTTPGSGGPILRLLAAGTFVPDVVHVRECAAEELINLEPCSADIVISNAVLEHLADVPLAFRGFAHVGRPGSIGLHQVDFRDHRDFSKPLEYLTLSAPDFATLFARRSAECGNRWRPWPMASAFEDAGFVVRRMEPRLYAEPAYLVDVKQRLHPDVYPIADRDLETISAFFVVDRQPLVPR